jgi:hypothetical protein
MAGAAVPFGVFISRLGFKVLAGGRSTNSKVNSRLYLLSTSIYLLNTSIYLQNT